MTYTDYPRPVIRGDIEKAIKALKRLCQDEGISKTWRENRYFLTRTQKRRQKAIATRRSSFPRKTGTVTR